MDINFMRATEGEIAKSIRTIQGVQSARVHLVVPKRELFSSDKQSPSASVILKMKGSSRLSVNQVLSIQHLIASAVPGLTLDKISIIDDKGTLLAKGDSSGMNDSSLSQQEAKQAFETKLSRSVESLLERTVGAGKVRAEVSADLNFDKDTSTSIEFNPDGQVARSTQSSSEGSNSNEASSSDAISVQNALPDAAAGQGNQSKNQDTRSEESTNFEITNTTRTHVKETGGVKRLSIAVLLDGTTTKDKDGKDVYTARKPEELQQLTELVKTAVGFDEKRGDVIKVINMQFNETPDAPDTTSALEKWMNIIFTPKVIDILTMLGCGLLVYFVVFRRIINSLAAASKEAARIAAEEAEAAALAATKKLPGSELSPEQIQEMEMAAIRKKTSSIKKITDVIEQHPEDAVAIIRNWMYN
jgi:flagellar M-ring protein FliF